MRRLGIRIANVALFTLCCFLVASVFNQFSGELLLPAGAAVAMPAPAQVATVRTWEERKAILERNLFDSKLGAPPVEAPPTPVEDLEETKLPLKLLGTAASDDPALSSAAIQDLSSRKHEVVRIGSQLEGHSGVQVAAIERKRVILDNSGRREELVLDEDAAATPTPNRSSRSRSTRRARPTPPQASSPTISDRLKEIEATRLGGRSTARLFSEARILPKYEDGQLVGVQLNNIKEGSLYERLGIVDGDTITELNGIQINDAAASAQVLSQFTEAEEFTIVVRGSDGITRTEHVTADELLEFME